MKKLSYLSTLAISIILFSCTSTAPISEGGKGEVNRSETALLWQQTSGEYKALCLQAFETAKMRIIAENMGQIDLDEGKEKAIVMDLDETVLDNSPYNVKLILEGEEYSEESWTNWVKAEKAKMIPGAIEFIEYAKENGYVIIFVSNRKQENFKYTINNLVKLGLDASLDNLYLDDGTTKEERRARLRENYDFLMLIGDNLADFHMYFEDELSLEKRNKLVLEDFRDEFGHKFIIMPNPLYGSWMKAVEKASKRRKDQLLLLESY